MVLGAVAVLSLVGACGGGSPGRSSSGGDSGARRAGPGVPAPAGGSTAGAVSRAGPPGAPAERDIVSTADVAITAQDVDAAAVRIVALVDRPGERVDGDDRADLGPKRSARLVLRVRPDRLEALIAAIGSLGVETSRTVHGEDVTTIRVDIDARVQSLATSVARLRAFLARSASVADLVTLEGQLTTRESDLEAMRAKQQALRDQIALATLTVTVRAPAAAAAIARRGVHPTGFARAVGDGAHALGVGVRVVLAGIGYALPFASAALVVAGAALLVRRRRRQPGPAPAEAGEPAS